MTQYGLSEELYKTLTKRYKMVVPYQVEGYVLGVKLNCPKCSKVMGQHSSDHEVMYREGHPVSISGYRCTNCGNTKPAYDIIEAATGNIVTVEDIFKPEPEPEAHIVDDAEEYAAELAKHDKARQQATERLLEESEKLLEEKGGEPVVEDATAELQAKLKLKGKADALNS